MPDESLKNGLRGEICLNQYRSHRRNNRKTGSFYEEKAAEYLINQGLRVTETNFSCRLGEIDLIAEDGGTLVFVEVKYRGSAGSGSAAEAVSRYKQERIYRCAQVYMKYHGISFLHPVRFDVLAMDNMEITWIQNAFGGM